MEFTAYPGELLIPFIDANGVSTFGIQGVVSPTQLAIGGAVCSNFTSRWATTSLKLTGGTCSVRIGNVAPFGSSDWTMRAWVYLTSFPTAAVGTWPGAWNVHGVLMGFGTSNLPDGTNIVLNSSQVFAQTNDAPYAAGVHGLALNAWNFIAACKQGQNVGVYVNTNRVGFTNSFPAISGTGDYFYIGSETGQGAGLQGYINDAHMIQSALYTTPTITLPTAPIALTSTHQLSTKLYPDAVGRGPYSPLIPPSGPPPAHVLDYPIGRLAAPPIEMLTGKPGGSLLGSGHAHWDMWNSGDGVVEGTAKYFPGYPINRRIRLVDAFSGVVYRETWSDPNTGTYRFENLSKQNIYTVLGFDYKLNYRAVIADRVLAT